MKSVHFVFALSLCISIGKFLIGQSLLSLIHMNMAFPTQNAYQAQKQRRTEVVI